jgi:hypothetical protein
MKARPILVPAKLLNVLYIPFLNSVIVWWGRRSAPINYAP